MRVAGILGIVAMVAGCASVPPAPPPDSAWSEWSAPERGLSCRARIPPHALRGGLLPVEFEVRADPATLPTGTTYLKGAFLEERMKIALRDPGSGATAEIWGSNKDTIGQADSFPLVPGNTRSWSLGFPLSDAWDALVPGTWEVRAVMESEPDRSGPGAWSGSVASPAAALVLAEPPLRPIACRVPGSIRLRPDRRVPGALEVFIDDECDVETVHLEARTGFLLGFTWERGGAGSCESSGGEECDALGWSCSIEPRPDGSIDETHTVSIYEYGRRPDPRSMWDPGPGRGAFRVLWTREYRVAFTAAEIEALRR